MAYGEHQDHEAPPTIEEKDLTWNTHTKIRDFFGFPQDPEFFATWLDFFYERLNQEQRRLLRNTDLTTLSLAAFPKPEHSPKE